MTIAAADKAGWTTLCYCLCIPAEVAFAFFAIYYTKVPHSICRSFFCSHKSLLTFFNNTCCLQRNNQRQAGDDKASAQDTEGFLTARHSLIYGF
jgi:hypothetical protein